MAGGFAKDGAVLLPRHSGTPDHRVGGYSTGWQTSTLGQQSWTKGLTG